MPNTRDIRRRIKSVKNTAQITKAMQMVAASRMRKAQQQALAGRPYAELLDEMTGLLETGKGDFTHPLLEKREVKKTAVLVITTDKGLCGALNANLLREVLKHDDASKVYVSVGRKGRQFLARMGKTLLADFELKDQFTFRESKQISKFLLEQFNEKKIDAIEVYYSHFINTINQKPEKLDLVPIRPDKVSLQKKEESAGEKKKATEKIDFIYEPNPRQLLEQLLPFYVHQEIYQTLLDAKASEHSARMVAMKNATDNAKQLIKDLTLEYNKARQAGITREILEIATAQAALN